MTPRSFFHHLVLGSLCAGELLAQDSSSETNLSISSLPDDKRAKVVVKTRTGDQTEEVVVDVNARSNEELQEKLKAALKAHDLDAGTQKVIHEALSRSGKDPFASAIVDAEGKLHDVQWHTKGQALPFPFPPHQPSTFEQDWPKVRKALKQVGVSPEKIARAEKLAHASILPDKRHMIGVQCRSLDQALRAHLKLDHGIVVEKTFPHTPAAKAGIQTHDILLQVNETQLKDVKDLVDAVQVAGIDEAALTLILLRGGEHLNIELRTQPQHCAVTKQTFNAPADLPRGLAPQQAPLWPQAEAQSLESLEETVESLQEAIEALQEKIAPFAP